MAEWLVERRRFEAPPSKLTKPRQNHQIVRLSQMVRSADHKTLGAALGYWSLSVVNTLVVNTLHTHKCSFKRSSSMNGSSTTHSQGIAFPFGSISTSSG